MQKPDFNIRVIHIDFSSIKIQKYKVHKIFTISMKNINIYSNIFYIIKSNKASMNLIEYLTPNKKKKRIHLDSFFLFILHYIII
ncbi:hypothetical protein COE82_15595 [Bacillus wiedmannii]|nr:hypothetical protein CN599_15455 [Bacillus wiedmannii]PEQ04606.1 hypothetical protein CN587_12590 [Bacillus wiedmannii]PEU28219.1 hypothetical protein CN526_10575 [Bacillus wiedmannii]PGA01055.1 hypothetical protein COL78_05290 [Bacillus wiedmannii]PHB40885.1 hypothetical protein COE82_15595 [Bacillus wiedmannii]